LEVQRTTQKERKKKTKKKRAEELENERGSS
jgi:hypothetical protein